MALIACPDCGVEVSDQATACPKCARPIALRTSGATAPRQRGNMLKIVGGLLCMVSVPACLMTGLAAEGASGGVVLSTIAFLVGLILFIAGRMQD